MSLSASSGTILWEGFLNIIPSDINFRQSEKGGPLWICLDYFFQGEVHPSVAIDQMAVERFAILELDQHRVALSRIQKT